MVANILHCCFVSCINSHPQDLLMHNTKTTQWYLTDITNILGISYIQSPYLPYIQGYSTKKKGSNIFQGHTTCCLQLHFILIWPSFSQLSPISSFSFLFQDAVSASKPDTESFSSPYGIRNLQRSQELLISGRH